MRLLKVRDQISLATSLDKAIEIWRELGGLQIQNSTWNEMHKTKERVAN